MKGWVEVGRVGSIDFGRMLRIDRRAVDAAGTPGWASVCLVPTGHRVPFDEPAVSHALRRVLARPWPRMVATLLADWSTFAGAITVADDRRPLHGDPFAGFLPQRIVELPAGELGSLPAPTGPAITRYGSGNPWPWDVYAGQHP